MLPSQLPYISSASGYSYHVLTAVSLFSLLPYLCILCSRFRVLGSSVFLAKLVQLELKSCFLCSSLPLSVRLVPLTEATPGFCWTSSQRYSLRTHFGLYLPTPAKTGTPLPYTFCLSKSVRVSFATKVPFSIYFVFVGLNSFNVFTIIWVRLRKENT